MTRAGLLCLALAAGCADEIADVEPLGDYQSWKRFDTWGNAPGHGDTYRIIYINELAAMYGGGEHEDGAIVVKEVRDNVNNGPGELQVIEIMRRIGPDTSFEGGWTFTAAYSIGGQETVQTFCWRRCHQAAPYAGAWFDYSK